MRPKAKRMMFTLTKEMGKKVTMMTTMIAIMAMVMTMKMGIRVMKHKIV